jgi:hypothetical protein
VLDRGDEIVVQAAPERIRFLLVSGRLLEEPGVLNLRPQSCARPGAASMAAAAYFFFAGGGAVLSSTTSP